MHDLTTLDFETAGIGPRPLQYPPKPVGLAIRWPDSKTEYLAFGHPSGNNSTFEEARRAWLLATRGPVLFQNGAFDIEVAMTHFDVPWPAKWHDTLFLLFLNDTHAKTYSLKPSAERLLGDPPTEQDNVRDWILANVPGATRKNFGAYISLAPVSLVLPYAIGDVERTFRLFQLLYERTLTTMPEAYLRELALCPHLIAAERRGIRMDRRLLTAWHDELLPAVARCDDLIRARLDAPNLSVDSDEELAAALDRAEVMRAWEYTDGTTEAGSSGEPVMVNPFSTDAPSVAPVRYRRRSVAKGALKRNCLDEELVRTLLYRNTAATMLRTFVGPWLERSAHDGRLHTKWHQVRGQDSYGTKTGRIASSDPNLTNVIGAKDITPPLGCPFLPALRSAFLPEEGHVWVSVDYSQQELRWAAHFEDGDMMRAYQQNPRLDLHDHAKKLILERTGLDLDRKKVKTVAFATIYGAGLKQLAAQMGTTETEAYAVREAYFTVLPGLRILSEGVRDRARYQGYVRSGGGRIIKVEPPRLIDGQKRTFDYKMLNHLIQGTSAEQTKQAIINYCNVGGPGPFLSQVYDEINVSAPVESLGPVANLLAKCMIESLPIDVPITVDVEVGNNWGNLLLVEPGSSVNNVLKELGHAH
jgi:DNA polymerase-1